VLLRREHARSGAAHLHLRPDQRHPALRAGDREPGLAGGAEGGPGARGWPEHPRGHAHLRARRRGTRAAVDRDRADHPLTSPGAGPGLAAAVSRYLDHLSVERGLSDHTLQAYRRDLARYQAAMAAQGRTAIAEVAAGGVAGFLGGPREGGSGRASLAAGSAARAVAAARGLHAFAAAAG